jgi:hypothetical protein
LAKDHENGPKGHVSASDHERALSPANEMVLAGVVTLKYIRCLLPNQISELMVTVQVSHSELSVGLRDSAYVIVLASHEIVDDVLECIPINTIPTNPN